MLHLSGGVVGKRHPGDLALCEHRFDLRVRLEIGHRLLLDPRPVPRRQTAIDPHVVAEIAEERRPAQLQLRRNRLADFRSLEPRIGAGCAGDPLGTKPFRDVHPAVVGGHDNRIVDSLRVQHLEEAGKVTVQRQQLQAHFLAA